MTNFSDIFKSSVHFRRKDFLYVHTAVSVYIRSERIKFFHKLPACFRR